MIVGSDEKAFFKTTGISGCEERINACFGNYVVFGVELALNGGEAATVREGTDEINAGIFGVGSFFRMRVGPVFPCLNR